MKKETLKKTATVISKVGEILHWVGAGMVAAILIGMMAGHNELMYYLTSYKESDTYISSGDFSAELAGLTPEKLMKLLAIFFVSLLITLVLKAMIFRNIHLSFKTAAGETKFSKGATPFQPDVIRMIREIGIFSIAIPIVNFITSIAGRIVVGSDADMSVGFGGIAMGIVVLCLSQFFEYGAELQKETEGLV